MSEREERTPKLNSARQLDGGMLPRIQVVLSWVADEEGRFVRRVEEGKTVVEERVERLDAVRRVRLVGDGAGIVVPLLELVDLEPDRVEELPSSGIS